MNARPLQKMPDNNHPEGESEEFRTFKEAMKQIVRVKKLDIVEDLPKMFRERNPSKITATPSKKKRKPRA